VILKGHSLEEAYELLESVTAGEIVCCVASNPLGHEGIENDYFRQ